MSATSPKPALNVGRVVCAFVALPVVLGLERWAYWGARTVMPLAFREQYAMSVAQYGTVFAAHAWIGAFTLLVGGALAIATGPGVTLALGAVISVAGYGVLAVSSSPGGAWVALALLALGVGLVKPSVMALAVVELAHPRSHLRSALLVLLYATSNVSALLSGPTAGAVSEGAGFRAAFVSSAVLCAVAAVLAVALAIVWFVLRPKAPSQPREALAPGRVALGAALIVVALVPYHLLLSYQSAVSRDLARSSSSLSAAASIFSLNPVAVLLSALVVLGCLVAFHLKGMRSYSLYAIGAGLALTAFAVIPMLLARSSLPAIGASSVAVGAAEVLVTPFALSRLAGDLPPRFSALAVAVEQCVAAVVSMGASVSLGAFHHAGVAFVGLGALVVLAVGIALLVAAAPLARALYAATPKDETTPDGVRNGSGRPARAGEGLAGSPR